MKNTSTALAKDPLGPLDGVVSMLLSLLTIGFVLGAVLLLLPGGSVTTYGSHEACSVVNAELLPNNLLAENSPTASSYSDHSYVRAREVEVCQRQAGPALHLLSLAATFSGLALLLAFVLVARSLVKQARNVGLFSPGIASRARLLGWVLIGGSLLAHLLRSVVGVIILNQVVVEDGYDFGAGALLSGFGFPITEIVVGIGLISVGRVLGRAVILQEHEDATI